MRSTTRHQLKQDQFTAAAQETMSWAVEHRNKLVYAGAAIAVVLAIVLGGWVYIQQQDEAAGLALGQAVQVYQAPIAGSQPASPEVKSFATVADRGKAARVEFGKVVDRYPHTRSADLARYFMGLADEDAGNAAAAEKELKDVAGSGRHDLAALAKFALAAFYHSSGKDAEAVTLYKDLIEHPTDTVAKSQSQLALAALYEAKQPQDARTLYQQIAKENRDGPAEVIAVKRLTDMK